MVSSRDTDLYRRDHRAHGKELTAKDREDLIKPYLPEPPPDKRVTNPISTSHLPQKRQWRKGHKKRVRPFLRNGLHFLIYHIGQILFDIYIRIRQTYRALVYKILGILYYHHRTPELIRRDVRSLDRLPEHLSVILHLRGPDEGGIERLLDEVAELAAWSASAGIPMLSIYEKSGILKSIIPDVHTTTRSKLAAYFGPSPQTPYLKVTAPHHSSYSPSPSPTPSESSQDSLTTPAPSLTLLLLSESDGRDTLVDLTRTLTEMAQHGKISPKDISMELIDAEISETTRASIFNPGGEGREFGALTGEPDLLIIFGPYVHLDGYPPWQIRLTEIFCTRSGLEKKTVERQPQQAKRRKGQKTQVDRLYIQSSRLAGSVEYQGFLRALWNYAGAQVRFGR